MAIINIQSWGKNNFHETSVAVLVLVILAFIHKKMPLNKYLK